MTAITRRGLTAGFAATLVARRAQAGGTDLEPAARAEATLTWYVAQMSGEAAEAIGRRFSERHPGIAVSVIRTTGQVTDLKCTFWGWRTEPGEDNTTHIDNSPGGSQTVNAGSTYGLP